MSTGSEEVPERDPRRERPGRTVRTPVRRVRGTSIGPSEWDEVVTEEPLEIRVATGGDRDSEPVAVTMRTPGHDFELAAGFVLTEGIARDPAEIKGLRYCTLPEEEQLFNVVNVDLVRPEPLNLEAVRRNLYVASSCGICGRASIDRVRLQGLRTPAPGPTLRPKIFEGLADRLRAEQSVFARTGGLHATGVADGHGSVRLVREDVGRHNAFDKVVGRLALDGGIPASSSIAIVSGRASFELVQKALVAGFPVLAAVGAPSHLAIDLAREYGLTLIGFLRGDRFNVYSGERRLAAD